MHKSTVEQIRQRFDKDVERFSNLATGQSAMIDAPLVLELISQAAATVSPHATHLLDIGCGAGNYTLKMLQAIPDLNVTLVDLSQPMLNRAAQRMAAAVFHHLRTDDEWESVFSRCFEALKPGGSFWISDLIEHSTGAIQRLMWARYGEYLTDSRDEAYRDQVFSYVEQEDTPRPLLFQIDLLRKVGFQSVEILHKNSVFAAFGAIK
jgi:tRNA (cmo5U34)-methyltransferase